MSDLIERQAAIDALLKEVRLVDGYYVENDEVIDKDDAIEAIRLLPSAQPGHNADHDKKVSISRNRENDLIGRQTAIDDLHGRDPSQIWDTADIEVWVNALPSVQTEPCEDAISRQRLLNDLKELITAWKKYPIMEEQIKGIGTAIGYVMAIPSVTPKRKTGKWILLEECANAGYYCSECRKRVVKEGWSGTVKKIKFCPNCGADMRKESR